MQGASPLASPRPSRKRHGLHLRCGCPAGGLARQVGGSASIGGAQRVVCPAGRRLTLPLALFLSPIPPHPRSQSALPVGKGAFSFLMQGASPLASPRPSRKRHGLHLRCGCPAGGLPGRSPGRPALSFICCPHPPAPLPPPGKGESQSLFRRGLRPRHPCTEPPTALTDAAVREPGGWFARQVAGSTSIGGARRGACPAGRRLVLPLALFLSPIPPAPLPPPGKGESQSLFRRGLRPRHPCTEPPTALAETAMQVPGGWFARQVAGSSCL